MSDAPASEEQRHAMLRDLLDDAEAAIGAHSPRARALYDVAADEVLGGLTEGGSAPRLRDARLYLTAMTFTSAWHARHGQGRRRRRALRAGVVAVASFADEPLEVVFDLAVKIEQAHLAMLRAERVGHGPWPRLALYAVVVAGVAWILLR